MPPAVLSRSLSGHCAFGTLFVAGSGHAPPQAARSEGAAGSKVHETLRSSDGDRHRRCPWNGCRPRARFRDRKSTRLNSSHTVISYAVFCLKKKKKKNDINLFIKKKQQQNKQ